MRRESGSGEDRSTSSDKLKFDKRKGCEKRIGG